MAIRDDYIRAMQKAHEAGDDEGARTMAAKVQELDSAAPVGPPAPVAAPPAEKAPLLPVPPEIKFLTDTFHGGVKSLKDMAYGAMQAGTPEPFAVADKIWPKAYMDKVREARSDLGATVASNEKADEPLMETPGGVIGKYGTDIATFWNPTKRAIGVADAVNVGAKAARASGEGVKRFLPRPLVNAAPGAAVGAAQGVVTPNEHYGGVTEEGGVSAGWGIVGDTLGRIGGRIIAPAHGLANRVLKEGRQAAYDAADTLNKAGFLPKVLAQHLVPELGGVTAQAARTPGLRGGLQEANVANRRALTERQAELAGVRGPDTSSMTGAKTAMKEDLSDLGDTFRLTQGDVPVTKLSKRLEQAYKNIEEYAQGTSQMSKAEKIKNASDAMKPERIPAVTQQVPPAPLTAQDRLDWKKANPGQPLPTNTSTTVTISPERFKGQTRTVDELMDLRNSASALLSKEMSKADPSQLFIQQYREMREMYEDQIRGALPKGQAKAFDDWLKQYGHKLDFDKAAKATVDKGIGKGIPSDTLDQMSTFKSVVRDPVTPGTANEQMLKLLAERAPGFKEMGTGIATETSRALGALGLPGAGAGIGYFTGGDEPGKKAAHMALGAAIGGGSARVLTKLLSTPGGAKYLTGRYINDLPGALEFLRKAGVAVGETQRDRFNK